MGRLCTSPRSITITCRCAAWAVVVSVAFLLLNISPAPAEEQRIARLTEGGRSYAEFGGGCSPVGDRVVFYRRETDNTRELWVMELETRKAQRVSGVGYPFNATWSRDGTKLAFLFAENPEGASEVSALVYNLPTAQPSRTALVGAVADFRVPEDRPWWSPDGARFVIQMKRKDASTGVFIVPADGGRVTQLAPNNPANSFSFSLSPNVWSPDGSLVAFVGMDPASKLGQVWVADPLGQNARTITGPLPDLANLAWSWDGARIAFGTSEGRLDEEKAESYLDLWVANADGAGAHPITHGSDPAKERRTYWMTFHWTRDNRYVMAWWSRSDEAGVERYRGFALVDPETQEVVPVFSYEVGTSDGFYNIWNGWADSWDGQRIALTGSRYTVRGPRGGEQQLEDERTVLRVFTVGERKLEDLLSYRPSEDGARLSPGIFGPSWSSDSRRLVLTIAKVISAEEGKLEPDLYLFDVVPSAVSPPEARQPEPTTTAGTLAGGVAVILPRNRRALEIADSLPASYRGLLRVDAGLNALVVSGADRDALAAIRRDVEALDRVVPEVMVDVLVTELSDEASRQLGMDWEYIRGSFSAVLPLAAGTPEEVIFRGVGSFDKSFFATLSMLAERGLARVRANPRVLARCGSQATINIRRTDNFFFDSGTDFQGRSTRARSDISADTILRITPQLLASGRICLQIDASVDSFVFGGRDELPDTTRRQATMDVVCGDGETVVIGGLTQEEQTFKQRKTPLLGDLPLLGQLFRYTARSTKQSTLAILITPHLVRAGEGG